MDRRSQRLAFVLLFFGLSYLLYANLSGPSRHHAASAATGTDLLDLSGLVPANSTLGFGAVVAVSRAASPRREGLLLAANITEIDITIPLQPTWTDDDVKNLRAEHDSTISRGSALAWLGHLNALRWFLSTDLETVLILEDDVDWDIHLRTLQIPKAAAAIRSLTSELTTPPSPLKYQPALNNYWGSPSTWDILYLGHCGDIFKPSAWSYRTPRILYPDETLPQRKEMHPYTQSFLESIDIPEGQRMIHQSVFPLCTFGFALTRSAAQRLLKDARRETDGGTMAYDVRVLEACRDLGFRCWSANPELFHHQDSVSEIAVVNDQPADSDSSDPFHPVESDPAKIGADEKGRLKSLRAGSAPNIACGARSKNFFTRDKKTLEFLREMVGRQGKCLKDTMEEDMAKLPT